MPQVPYTEVPRFPERLLTLAVLLENDAKNPSGAKFDLSGWVGIGGSFSKPLPLQQFDLEHDEDVFRKAQSMRIIPQSKLPGMTCGTKGCALGLAMLSGLFEQFGMVASYYEIENGIMLVPMCNGQDGFEAGSELFGISEGTSRYLFDPDCYVGTPREAAGELRVADRIRELVAGSIEQNYHPEYNEDYGDDED